MFFNDEHFMIKTGGCHDLNGIPNIEIVDYDSQYKYANADEEIVEFLNIYSPLPGHFYVRIINVAAGDYWGANNNADFFPERFLEVKHPNYGYYTFKLYAKVYRHHANKNPENSYGNIVFVTYNPVMKYVESVVELPLSRNQDVYDKLVRGQYPNTSMGTKVPYDICSICGRKARGRKDRCEHILYQKNTLMADGRHVHMINYYPRFFDQSIVIRPADNIALGVERVIPKGNIIKLDSKERSMDDGGLRKVASDEKVADIIKEVQSDIVDFGLAAKRVDKEMRKRQLDLPDNFFKDVEGYSKDTVKKALSILGIEPTSDEADKMEKVAEGEGGLNTLLIKLGKYCPIRSNLLPYYANRLVKLAGIKITTENNSGKGRSAKERMGAITFPLANEESREILELGTAAIPFALAAIPGTISAGFELSDELKEMVNSNKKMPKSIKDALKKLPFEVELTAGKFSRLTAALMAALGAGYIIHKAGKLGKEFAFRGNEKKAALHKYIATAAPIWFISNYNKAKQEMGKRPGAVGRFTAEHPWLATGAALGAVGVSDRAGRQASSWLKKLKGISKVGSEDIQHIEGLGVISVLNNADVFDRMREDGVKIAVLEDLKIIMDDRQVAKYADLYYYNIRKLGKLN